MVGYIREAESETILRSIVRKDLSLFFGDSIVREYTILVASIMRVPNQSRSINKSSKQFFFFYAQEMERQTMPFDKWFLYKNVCVRNKSNLNEKTNESTTQKANNYHTSPLNNIRMC